MTRIDITPVSGLEIGPAVLLRMNGQPHLLPAEFVREFARDLLAAAAIAGEEETA